MKRFLLLAPWVVVMVGMDSLLELYPRLPESWPCHWNAAGVIDGWCQKSYSGLLMPMGIAALLCVIFEGLAQLMAFLPTPQLPEPWGQRSREVNQDIARCISLAVVSFITYIAWKLPQAQGCPVGKSAFILVVLCLVLPLLRFTAFSRDLRRAGVMPSGYSGAFYSNAEDPRVWVPKLCGYGLTLNFAHRAAWLWLGLLLTPAVLAVTLVVAQSR